MPTAVAMPKLGMTMEEGIVVEWRFALGAYVERGQVILIIESEKAQVEIEATGSGILRHIYVAPEHTVPCGSLLAVLCDDDDINNNNNKDEEPFDPLTYKAQYEAEHSALPPPRKTEAAPRSSLPPNPFPTKGAHSPVTPAARKLARSLDLDPSEVAGSGPGGRVTREDVESHALGRKNLVRVAQGVALDVPASGAGDPVLLLPGFGTDVSAFFRQLPTLSAKFAVRGVNPRGVAHSDAPESEKYEIATLACDVAALIDAPAHLIGSSLGAAIALEVALTYPEKVRSLSLITPLVTVSGRLDAVTQIWCELAAKVSAQELATGLLPWLFAEATLGDRQVRARIARGLATSLARAQPAALVRTRAGLLAWSGTRAADLARIDLPTQVIVAAEDLLTTNGLAIAAAIPSAICTTIEGAGHAVGIEAAEAVNDALLSHLA